MNYPLHRDRRCLSGLQAACVALRRTRLRRCTAVATAMRASAYNGFGLIAACIFSLLLLAPIVSAAQEIPANAKWITALGAPVHAPQVLYFRKVIQFDKLPTRYLVHVSADNRFQLYVNGKRVGDGPARGDRRHWRYETFNLGSLIRRGENIIAARVWNFGDQSPAAQMSVRTGFLLWVDPGVRPDLSTNASWSGQLVPGWSPQYQGFPATSGEMIHADDIDLKWDVLPVVDNWPHAVPIVDPVLAKDIGKSVLDNNWHLVPDTLPPMEYTPISPGHVVRSLGVSADNFPGHSIEIPAHTHASILLERSAETTAYLKLTVGGGAGAKIRLTYAEALVNAEGAKGNRDHIAGKHMDMGMLHDEFFPDGSSRFSFSPLWWRAWRFLQINVDTANQPVTLFDLDAHFTAYPFQKRASFHSNDPQLNKIWNVGWHTLRLNAHETHMDCPYWERQQYVGDTRIETLIDYVVSGDDRLAKQAILSLADSAIPDGLTQSRYPSNGVQIIPPFSLLWVGMVHDYWMYNSDPALVRKVLPVSRSTIHWFAAHQRPDGLLGKLPQNGFQFWNFVDWSYAPMGAPPETKDGGSVPITLQFVAALRDAADLEDAVGSPTLARSYRENADRTAAAVYRLCWDKKRQLLADTPAHQHFSQQSNILGVMLNVIPPAKQKQVMKNILAYELAGNPAYPGPKNLTIATYYFRFYLARAIEHAGMGNLYLKLLGPWKHMLSLGLTTWAETPEPTRSDAHAWSAHPTYDLLTIVAGISPGSPGFKTVRIAPHLGDLNTLDASMPHGHGEIKVSYRRTQEGVVAKIDLPAGLSGVLVWKDHKTALHPGEQNTLLQ